jgi:hypothetical protein
MSILAVAAVAQGTSLWPIQLKGISAVDLRAVAKSDSGVTSEEIEHLCRELLSKASIGVADSAKPILDVGVSVDRQVSCDLALVVVRVALRESVALKRDPALDLRSHYAITWESQRDDLVPASVAAAKAKALVTELMREFAAQVKQVASPSIHE